jgi:hypothetical protein
VRVRPAAHRWPFARDWKNDSKNQQSRPKHQALGSRSQRRSPRGGPGTELAELETMRIDACNGGMAMLPRIFLARLEQI